MNAITLDANLEKPLYKSGPGRMVTKEDLNRLTNGKMLPPRTHRKEHPFVGFIRFQGIPIDIENKKGSYRSGTDRTGKTWRTKMNAHYGEICGTLGVDGDCLDVYVMDNPNAPMVYIVDQMHPDTGKFDEQKVICGAGSEQQAVDLYKSQYDRPGFLGKVHSMTMDQFKSMLKRSGESGKRLTKALEDITMDIVIVGPIRKALPASDIHAFLRRKLRATVRRMQGHIKAGNTREIFMEGLHHDLRGHIDALRERGGLDDATVQHVAQSGVLNKEMMAHNLPESAKYLTKAVPFGLSSVPHTPPSAVPPTPPPAFHQQQPSAVDSQQEHSRSGVYHPARAQMHQDIIHHFLHGGGEHADLHEIYGDHARGNPQKQAVFMAGGGGSGKSYYAKRKFGQHHRFSFVDPDAIKEEIAKRTGKPGDHNVRPGYYHEESSDVAKQLHHEAMQHGRNFVYDGTGANKESLAKKIQQTKAQGYHVSLHYAKTNLATARERDLKRDRSLTRTMGEDFLPKQHATVEESFHHNRKLVDRAKVIDTSQPKTSEITARRIARQAKLVEEGRLKKGIGNVRTKKPPSHHTPEVHTAILVKPGIYWLGKIEKGLVHVHDIVDHGVSERHLTGQSPALHPVPWERLQKIGAKVVDHQPEIKNETTRQRG